MTYEEVVQAITIEDLRKLQSFAPKFYESGEIPSLIQWFSLYDNEVFEAFKNASNWISKADTDLTKLTSTEEKELCESHIYSFHKFLRQGDVFDIQHKDSGKLDMIGHGLLNSNAAYEFLTRVIRTKIFETVHIKVK